MKISVCIDAIYKGKDFIESLHEISNIGIDTFEFWGWWNKDIELIEETRELLQLNVAAFCTRFVSLVDPSKRNEYVNGLMESIQVAKKLNCKNLISQVGNELSHISREEQHYSLVQGLKECIPYLKREGITLLVEPLNTLVNHKGYYLSSSVEAFQIVEEVGSPNVKILYDIYHQQIMEGNIISTISNNIEKIGHFHAAGNPGRNELNRGELNYNGIFQAIDAAGFSGFVGLEYFPLEDPKNGLMEFGC